MGTFGIISTIIIALITSVGGPLVITWYKNKNTPKKTTISEDNKFDEEVYVQLESISEIIKCDRTWVAQFHNGGNFYPTGKSIRKFSIFYEKTSPGHPVLQYIFQNIPISLFPKALSVLSKQGELMVTDFSSTEFYDLLYLNKEFGAKSLYLLAITDLKNQFIGMLEVSFIENNRILNAEEWTFLRKKANQIGTILNNSLINKKE